MTNGSWTYVCRSSHMLTLHLAACWYLLTWEPGSPASVWGSAPADLLAESRTSCGLLALLKPAAGTGSFLNNWAPPCSGQCATASYSPHPLAGFPGNLTHCDSWHLICGSDLQFLSCFCPPGILTQLTPVLWPWTLALWLRGLATQDLAMIVAFKELSSITSHNTPLIQRSIGISISQMEKLGCTKIKWLAPKAHGNSLVVNQISLPILGCLGRSLIYTDSWAVIADGALLGCRNICPSSRS